MTVLVTGSRGRVGAALVDLLHTNGVAVRAASAAPEKLEPPAGVPTMRCDLGTAETLADSLLDHWARSDGSPAPLTRTVEELTGRPARTFAAWAREHAGAFTG